MFNPAVDVVVVAAADDGLALAVVTNPKVFQHQHRSASLDRQNAA